MKLMKTGNKEIQPLFLILPVFISFMSSCFKI